MTTIPLGARATIAGVTFRLKTYGGEGSSGLCTVVRESPPLDGWTFTIPHTWLNRLEFAAPEFPHEFKGGYDCDVCGEGSQHYIHAEHGPRELDEETQ